MPLQDYQIITKIGHGKFSSVYKIKRKIDSVLFALKKVQLNKLQQRGKMNAFSEQKMLKELNHPNIISLIQSSYDEQLGCLYLILQLSDEGDLQAKINHFKLKNLKVEQEDIWNIICQISNGLSYLHSKNIMHRDIKPSNILQFQPNNYKIADMNISKISNYMNYTRTGTFSYACPQIWKGESYDIKSDIWSFGCMIYELMFLKKPFFSQDMNQMYKKVTKCYFININCSYSNDLKNLVSSMMQLNPKMRPSALYIYKTSLNHQQKIKSQLTMKRSQNFTPFLVNNKLKIYKIQQHKEQKAGSLFKKSKSDIYEPQKQHLINGRCGFMKTRLQSIQRTRQYELQQTLKTEEDLQSIQIGVNYKRNSKIIRNRVLKVGLYRKRLQTEKK